MNRLLTVRSCFLEQFFTMKTVGQLLKEKRLEKDISLELVEQETKIRKKFLKYIEDDAFHLLPDQTYAQGFIKNYAEYLGLNSRTIMAFFRRQTRVSSKPSTAIVPKGFIDESIVSPRYVVTPAKAIMIVLISIAGIFLLYFGYQYYISRNPPAVVLESPQEGMVTSGKRVEVIGKTDTDATVMINGIGALVRSDGRFFDQVAVFPGENTITITATSRYGKSTVVSRTVIVKEDQEQQ